MNIKKISLFTPYPKKLNDEVFDFFVNALPEKLIWDPLLSYPWLGKKTETDFPAFSSSSFLDDNKSPM